MDGSSPNSEGSQSSASESSPHRYWRRVRHFALLGLVLGSALGARIYRIGQPPLDFAPTRQYFAALQARCFYLEHAPAIPKWRKVLAVQNSPKTLEFPLLQRLAALGYRLHGGEDLQIPRLLSVFAWFVGGILMYCAARRLASPSAALVASAFFLLCPFGVAASRSFQPDPLMVTLLILTYLTLLEYGARGGPSRLFAAATSGGLAVLVKPMVLFQVVAGFLAVWYTRRGRGRDRSVLHLGIFVAVVAALGAGYYLHEWFAPTRVRSWTQQAFLPHLLLTAKFWQGWLAQSWKVVGFLAPVAALMGFLSLHKGVARRFVVGLAGGYVAFGLFFNYHCFTHDYYHLQLIPLVALALAPFTDRVTASLREARLVARVSTDVVLLLMFVAAVLDLAVVSFYREWRANFGDEVATYREVGGLVGHEANNVLLASYYGQPLEYYGEIGGVSWPYPPDLRLEGLMGMPARSAEERLAAMVAVHDPRYFIATDLPELHAQQGLERFLALNFEVKAKTDRYVIYDLKAPRLPSAPPPSPPGGPR